MDLHHPLCQQTSTARLVQYLHAEEVTMTDTTKPSTVPNKGTTGSGADTKANPGKSSGQRPDGDISRPNAPKGGK